MDPRLGHRFPEMDVDPRHRYLNRCHGVDGACLCESGWGREKRVLIRQASIGGESFSSFSSSLIKRLVLFSLKNEASRQTSNRSQRGGSSFTSRTVEGDEREAELADAVAAANAISFNDQVDDKSLVLMKHRIKEAMSRWRSAVPREGEEDD